MTVDNMFAPMQNQNGTPNLCNHQYIIYVE